MKPFRVHRFARREISGAFLYYQYIGDPALSVNFQQELEMSFQELGRNPQRFPRWFGTEVRKHRLRRFPYLIFYVDRADHIQILAVAHASRRPGYWKSRISVD